MFYFNQLRKISVISVGLLFSLCCSLAMAQDNSNNDEANKSSTILKTTSETRKDGASTNAVLSNVRGGNSGFRFQTALTHIPKLRNDQEDTTDILLRADYTFNKKHRVRIQQFYTKLYGKYNSEYDFQATDTTLAHYYTLPKVWETSLQWRTGVVLPVSNNSVRDDLVTRVTGSLIGIKPFMGGRILAIAVPYARYHWYEYKTSVSGRLLPYYTLGASLTGVYMITPKLSFAPTINYNFEAQRQSQFEPDPQQQSNGFYSFDLDLSYQFTKGLSASLGYTQGSNYYQNGRYELVFYDNENSRYTVGMSYIF